MRIKLVSILFIHSCFSMVCSFLFISDTSLVAKLFCWFALEQILSVLLSFTFKNSFKTDSLYVIVKLQKLFALLQISDSLNLQVTNTYVEV